MTGDPQSTPTVASGKRFIVNFIALQVRLSTSTDCFLVLDPTAYLGEFPGKFAALSTNLWTGTEQMFVGLNPGDRMFAACYTNETDSVVPATLDSVVSGYRTTS